MSFASCNSAGGGYTGGGLRRYNEGDNYPGFIGGGGGSFSAVTVSNAVFRSYEGEFGNCKIELLSEAS